MGTIFDSNRVCGHEAKEARTELAKLICEMPNTPVILFVRNDEICDDGLTTGHAIDFICVNEVLQYNGRFYDDEKDFVYVYNDNWYDLLERSTDFDEKEALEEAHKIWKQHAVESICVFTTGAALPDKAIIS